MSSPRTAMQFSYRRDGIEVAHHPRSPLELVRAPVRNFELLRELVRRDVGGRYRGSALGLFWSLLQPLAMIAAYTVVFGVFLKARWHGEGSGLDYALAVFAGLIVYNVVAEVIARSPQLVIDNPNYVKKVVFPLELLPWMAVGSSLAHAVINIVVWCACAWAIVGHVPLTIVFVPLVLVPVALLALGLSYAISAAGAYLRDIGQATAFVNQLLLFLTPIFYSIAVIPAQFRPVLALNPLTFLVEQARGMLLAGIAPDVVSLTLYAVGAFAFAATSFAWFQHVREGFADVV